MLKSVRLNALFFFSVSLSVLPPSIPPLQGQYPGRESGPACWCHLLYRRRLRLTLLLCHRVLLCSWILLWVYSIRIQLRGRYAHHLLWKTNPPVLLNSPLIQRKMNGMKTGKMNRKGQRKKELIKSHISFCHSKFFDLWHWSHNFLVHFYFMNLLFLNNLPIVSWKEICNLVLTVRKSEIVFSWVTFNCKCDLESLFNSISWMYKTVKKLEWMNEYVHGFKLSISFFFF